MKGDAKPLLQFMDGADKRFIIPVYQRNYDWKIEHCRQLYDDLVRVIKQDRKSHFFGSIVSSLCDGASSSDYLIIDGQQRITTISLLFLALVKLLEQNAIESSDPILCMRIKETYLIDKYQPNERKVRLKPVKHDSRAFEKLLFEDESEYIQASNVTQNFIYFYNRIKDRQELSPTELYEAIKRLCIIDIFLHQDDNPQLIFESLNSTGLGLEEGDKIRNFVLMGLEVSKQEIYYEKYWNKIEINTDYDVSSFVRDYLTLKLGKITSFKYIYSSFKTYINDSNLAIEDVLVDLLAHAQNYNKILHASTQIKKVDTVLARLNHLEMRVTFPFLLALFKHKEEVTLADDELKEILECIESFIFRRFVCGIPTNALNKIFSTLHKDVIRLQGDNDSYLEVLKYVLLSKKSSGAFPTNEEFVELFSTRNMYRINPKNREYLFDRLENEDNVERVNIINMLEDGTLTVEHIMPQTLNTQWKNDLGEDALQIHETWLHTIANLTLTGYNSKYSNRSFSEKRSIEKGFIESGLRLNKYVASCERWTLSEIKNRRDILNKKALELWSYPQTNFTPPVKEREVYTLDDDFIFTGYSISSYSFLDTLYPVTAWVEMFIDVVRKIYELYPAKIHAMTERSEFIEFSKTPDEKTVRIANNVYLYTASSTMFKIRSLHRILEDCEIDKDSLAFEIYMYD